MDPFSTASAVPIAKSAKVKSAASTGSVHGVLPHPRVAGRLSQVPMRSRTFSHEIEGCVEASDRDGTEGLPAERRGLGEFPTLSPSESGAYSSYAPRTAIAGKRVEGRSR